MIKTIAGVIMVWFTPSMLWLAWLLRRPAAISPRRVIRSLQHRRYRSNRISTK